MIPAVRYLKNADSPVLREKPIISPRNASASEWTLPRILKIKNSHDTPTHRSHSPPFPHLRPRLLTPAPCSLRTPQAPPPATLSPSNQDRCPTDPQRSRIPSSDSH